MSKETSIWGTPLGAGGIPTRSNCPSNLLSAAMGLSPWNTLIVTAVWLSAAVLNTCDFFVGIVVFFSISGVKTPPRVSIPRVNGVTSKSNTSFTSPANTPPWIAAPFETHSIGSTPPSPFLPTKSSTSFLTIGILVGPPTKIILSTSPGLRPASFKACSVGAFDF